jgi:hypothetical protein
MSQIFNDRCANAFRAFKYLVIPEPQDPVALTSQEMAAFHFL